MRAKSLTNPKKTKCKCGNDLVTTRNAPRILSSTGKEICLECKMEELLHAF